MQKYHKIAKVEGKNNIEFKEKNSTLDRDLNPGL